MTVKTTNKINKEIQSCINHSLFPWQVVVLLWKELTKIRRTSRPNNEERFVEDFLEIDFPEIVLSPAHSKFPTTQ